MSDLAILIFASVINTGLGLVVYLRNPRSKISIYFLLICLSIVAWTTSNYITDHAADLEARDISARIATLTGFNILFWLVAFSRQFGSFTPLSPAKRVGLAIFYLAVSLLSVSRWVVESVSMRSNGTDIAIGPAYWPFLLVLAGLFLATAWHLVQTRRRAPNALIVTQINYMLLGISTSVSLAILTNAVLPVFIDSWQLAKWGPLLTVFFVATVSYSIIKHRLFDIRLILARALAYVTLVSVIFLLYTSVVFIIGSLVFHDAVLLERVVVYAIASLFVAVTFQPLKQLLERVTDRVLFQSRYDVNALLYDVTRVLATSQGVPALTGKTLDLMLERMHISRGAFFIITPHGLTQPANRNVDFDDEDTLDLLGLLGSDQQLLILEDQQDEHMKQVMRQLNVNVVATLNSGQKLQGALLLGEKLSGQIYTDQDIQVLNILTPELAVSLENALHFEQMSQFNQVLEHEVQQATQDLRVANDQLSQKNRQLEQLDKLKDEFISVTSHELRTPLTAIRGYLWMIQHGKRGDEKFHDYLSRAYISTERLLDIVNDTLDISRIESGRVQLAPQPTNIVDLADEVVVELTPKAKERQQSLRLNRPSGIPAAECDANKIHQVLINLVGNALKFTPEHGKIEVDFVQQDGHIIVKVSDNGPGMSQEDQTKIFHKFARLEATSSVQGTGLGLYLCKQIVELSGGKIWIDSQPGQGATFSFSLPISTHQPSVLPSHQRQFHKPSPPPSAGSH